MNTFLGGIHVFGGFMAGLLGGLLMFLLGHPVAALFQKGNPLLAPNNASDVIAVANTYIVFTTFIFVLITVVVTVGGMWFARWFGLSKEKEIKENMRELFESLNSDSKLADRFVRELFEHKQIADKLHKLVQVRVENELSLRGQDGFDDSDVSDIAEQLAG